MKFLNWVKSVFLIIFLVLALPIFLVVKILEKPVKKSYSEIEAVLREMEQNNQQHNDWDSFLNVPIADKSLDKIRERVEVLWDYDEFMYETVDNGWLLNQKGLLSLREIINDLEKLKT